MVSVWLFTLALLPAAGLAADASAVTNGVSVVLAVGAPGEPEYGSNFVQQAQLWLRASEQAGVAATLIGLDDASEPTDRERLRTALAAEPPDGTDPLWLVLIGHGTYDGREARFNLRGPDVSATDLAEWLKPVRRPLIVINTASASAPFLNQLSGTNRMVVTATRSGSEQNFARFGSYFARALADPAGDLDQDGQVSLLEAFLSASAGVREFYQTEGRLATEHALLDDNGDGRGTPADWFRGVCVVKQADAGKPVDGARAHQVHLVPSAVERALPPEVRQHRDALEREILRLREQKSGRDETEYYRDLEKLLLELARLLEANSVSKTDASPE
ncbi:MAG: hypothetical protein IPM17_06055 [Verrucomicrobia bacterium]|nr:hypothetical protein [Verrucomicrobiota bacterium]